MDSEDVQQGGLERVTIPSPSGVFAEPWSLKKAVWLLGVFGPGLLVDLYGVDYQEAAHLLLWMLPILVLRSLGALIFPALLATVFTRADRAREAVHHRQRIVLAPKLQTRLQGGGLRAEKEQEPP